MSIRLRFVVALVACCLLRAPHGHAQHVRTTSYRAPDGSRVLQHQVMLPASREEVWQAFTTTDGLKAWAVPVAHADFRVGGIWETTYDLHGKIGAEGNIQNRYLGFIPNRLLLFQTVAAPPRFPHRELLADIVTAAEIDSLAPRESRLTLTMVGYRDGVGYDVLYRHFDAGNKWSLEKLRQRFLTGPVDWTTELMPKKTAAP